MRSVVLIGIGLIAVLIALYLTVLSDDDDKLETPEERVEDVQNAEPSATPPVSEPEKPDFIAPSFDVVRINPGGDAVIAGRATPGAMVEIMDGDTVIGTVKADPRGEWVFLPDEPLKAGEVELSLRSRDENGNIIQSEDVVVLIVPEGEGEAIAMSMPRDGKGAVKPMQLPKGDDLVLSIDTVNYDEEGELHLSGRAPSDAIVQLYLNEDFLGKALADETMRWSLSPETVITPGIYTLRADHVDEAGNVLNRVKIPFSRAEASPDIPKDRQFVVQPGNSLWRISRNLYGSGFDYVVIYQANKEQISDPDLIYPGQVFEIPSSSE